MLGYWMLLQVLGGIGSAMSQGGGVAFWAHIGGFVAGVALIKLFARSEYITEHRARQWQPQQLGWHR
jgi:membrane associated rhomboid family serine protease